MKLTQAEMINLLSQYETYQNLTKYQLKTIVYDLLELIKVNLLNGNSVSLKDIGTLLPIVRKGRNGVNPSTSEPLVIPDRKAVKLKLSSTLKRELNP